MFVLCLQLPLLILLIGGFIQENFKFSYNVSRSCSNIILIGSELIWTARENGVYEKGKTYRIIGTFPCVSFYQIRSICSGQCRQYNTSQLSWHVSEIYYHRDQEPNNERRTLEFKEDLWDLMLWNFSGISTCCIVSHPNHFYQREKDSQEDTWNGLAPVCVVYCTMPFLPRLETSFLPHFRSWRGRRPS